MEKDERLVLPTTQQLFELSFLQMKVKLEEVTNRLPFTVWSFIALSNPWQIKKLLNIEKSCYKSYPSHVLFALTKVPYYL